MSRSLRPTKAETNFGREAKAVWRRGMHRTSQLVCVLLPTLAVLTFPMLAAASEYHGQVTSGGFPVPGASVRVTQGTRRVSTVTDQGGSYSFADLAEGSAKIEIEMQGFRTI